VDGSSDIGILLFNVGNDLAVGAVETDLFTGVADLAAHLTSNCFEVNLGFVEARHFTKKDNHAGFGGGLHSAFGVGVGFEAGVKDSIGNLIAKLVGVTLTDGLGSEVDVFVVSSGSCVS